jgi:hypothetical protein
MRTTRIEIDSAGGHVAIERKPGQTTIRIDSIIRQPRSSQQAWKSWEVAADIKDEELFKVATEVQERTDGKRGTNSMIHDYYREMQRFQD